MSIQESRQRYLLYVPPRVAVRVPKRRAKGSADPQQPWISDYPWRPAGIDPDYPAAPGGSWPGRLAILGLIGLCNLALLSDQTWLMVLVLVLDLVGVLILFDSILKVVHWLRHPRTRMRWTTFPAFLGGRLEGTFTVRPGQHVMTSIQVRLRCVRDERVEHPTQEGATSALEPYVIYEQSLELPPPGDTLDELPLTFDLPADLPGTDLGRNEATYWQVALRIPVPGPDVEAVFLAPVYARAESTATAV